MDGGASGLLGIRMQKQGSGDYMWETEDPFQVFFYPFN